MTSQALVQAIIYPPDDVKVIIDKTAKFVARIGADFEKKVQTQVRLLF